MTEKLLVNKNVFKSLNAILEASKTQEDKDRSLNQHIKNVISSESWVFEEFKALNELTIQEFAKAIYVGYELEKTPEERK